MPLAWKHCFMSRQCPHVSLHSSPYDPTSQAKTIQLSLCACFGGFFFFLVFLFCFVFFFSFLMFFFCYYIMKLSTSFLGFMKTYYSKLLTTISNSAFKQCLLDRFVEFICYQSSSWLIHTKTGCLYWKKFTYSYLDKK